MYYVDCACAKHDMWAEFKTQIEAEGYYNSLDCYNKILYSHDTIHESSFKTIRKHEGREEVVY